MKKTLQFLFIALVMHMADAPANAQVLYGTSVLDTTIVNFTTLSDTSTGLLPAKYVIDTAGMGIWQIGHTTKKYFTKDTTAIFGMMTDTLNPYPVNVNNWFILKIIPYGYNTIISFWHRYQTTASHDGGIVEYSADSGMTWQNVLGDCNADGIGEIGLHTSNFYGKYDTLLTGEQAFSGTSAGWQYSSVQFYNAIALKGTTVCDPPQPLTNVYLRFRFMSDSIPDSLDGWMITAIKVEHDQYPGYVKNVNGGTLHIYPNPSATGMFTFPVLDNSKKYTIEILNPLGQTVLSIPYTQQINLSPYPTGVYFYKVSGLNEQYTGTLLKE